MDINIMLFFQIGQFGIAYFFLYRYLFAPAYKILDEQELFEKKLYKDLEQEQGVKVSLEKTYRQRQLMMKESLMNMVPADAVETHLHKLKGQSILYHVDHIEISKNNREQTETFLVENLSQVRK
ncbi:hypothetical protein [Candidatus Chromulinivorax destructor]|uniref:Uncharacterized protein n=1 Tax=Candidatus Chromulinivorax destructor TaxID=2066483 RepID=A0A345ZBB5_9BACT|nr:hypothetical protein [Candidatus Chromulinivorax destructor]AXK60582.1 hypothetical protein C0J27_02385 [Candidatus Chromulinivorax destructor]